jgi:hypothetical protein
MKAVQRLFLKPSHAASLKFSANPFLPSINVAPPLPLYFSSGLFINSAADGFTPFLKKEKDVMGLLYQPVFMLFALSNVNPSAVIGPLYMGDVVLSGSVPSTVYRIVGLISLF